jgi:diaminopimelate decarboxylase
LSFGPWRRSSALPVCLQQAILLDHCRHIERAFDGHPHVTYYAAKANANNSFSFDREALAPMSDRGELYLALGGFPRSVSLTAAWGSATMVHALQRGIRVQRESVEELDIIDQIAARTGTGADPASREPGHRRRRARLCLDEPEAK